MLVALGAITRIYECLWPVGGSFEKFVISREARRKMTLFDVEGSL